MTILLNCPDDGHAQWGISLTQGGTVAEVHGSASCSGGLEQIPIEIQARGNQSFQPGPATAVVNATIREKGEVTQQLDWTRAVTLSFAPWPSLT